MSFRLKSFTRSVLIITLFAIFTRGIGFLFRIFLARILSSEELGLYQVAMSIFMVLLTVISSGLPLVISREYTKTKDINLAYSGLYIGITTSLIVCFLVLIFTDNILLIALLPAIVASSVYCVLRAVWWGEKKFVLLGLTELIEQIARVLIFVFFLLFAFVFGGLANLSAWSFTAACMVSATVVIIIFLHQHKKGIIPGSHSSAEVTPRSYYKYLLKTAAPITAVRIVASVSFPIISILLPMRLFAAGWAYSDAIAHFGIIVAMVFPILTIPSTVISALSTALVPEISSSNLETASSIPVKISKSIKFTIFLSMFFIPCFIIAGRWLGVLLYDNTFAGIYLARSAWVMLPLSLSQITGTILNGLGHERRAMFNYFIGSILLFIIVWFGSKFIGADSVMIGLGTSTLISSILNLIWLQKYLNKK
ncbi:MAG: oligosaccharide flippase family protein [Christensenellaceae bacterium]|nr:oligosaccharide flippase family protein [Christensenellaceae bacterium]